MKTDVQTFALWALLSHLERKKAGQKSAIAPGEMQSIRRRLRSYVSPLRHVFISDMVTHDLQSSLAVGSQHTGLTFQGIHWPALLDPLERSHLDTSI